MSGGKRAPMFGRLAPHRSWLRSLARYRAGNAPLGPVCSHYVGPHAVHWDREAGNLCRDARPRACEARTSSGGIMPTVPSISHNIGRDTRP